MPLTTIFKLFLRSNATYNIILVICKSDL